MENSREEDFKVWIQTLVPVELKMAIFSLFIHIITLSKKVLINLCIKSYTIKSNRRVSSEPVVLTERAQ